MSYVAEHRQPTDRTNHSSMSVPGSTTRNAEGCPHAQ